jgi:hypothetical protein
MLKGLTGLPLIALKSQPPRTAAAAATPMLIAGSSPRRLTNLLATNPAMSPTNNHPMMPIST